MERILIGPENMGQIYERKIPRVVTYGFLLATAAMLVCVQSGWACDCSGPVGRDALPAAAAMFSGKATRVQFLESDAEGKEPRILVTFKVHEVWKGPVRRAWRVRTTYNKWTCDGYYFKEGKSYLVTAHEAKAANGELELAKVNICGGTRELVGAQDALRTLGPGKRPHRKASHKLDLE